MATCRTTDCNGKPRARGICVRCYAHLRVLVTKGQITWDELVNLGLVDAAAEGPAKDTPIKRAMAAAKVKLRPSQSLAVIDPDQEPPEHDRVAAMTALKTSVVEPDPHVPPQSHQPANSAELLEKMRQVGKKTTLNGVLIEYEPQDSDPGPADDGDPVDAEEVEDPKQIARRRQIEAKHLNQQREDAKHGPPMPMPPPPCAGPSAEYVDMGEVRGIIAKEGSGCKVEFSPSAPGAQVEMPTPWLADKREASGQNKSIVMEHDNQPRHPEALPLSRANDVTPEPVSQESEIILQEGMVEDAKTVALKLHGTKPITLPSNSAPEVIETVMPWE